MSLPISKMYTAIVRNLKTGHFQRWSSTNKRGTVRTLRHELSKSDAGTTGEIRTAEDELIYHVERTPNGIHILDL